MTLRTDGIDQSPGGQLSPGGALIDPTELVGGVKQVTIAGLLSQLEELESRESWDYHCVRLIGLAMSGDMVWRLPTGLTEDVLATDLNAAAAGTLKRSFALRLETKLVEGLSEVHVWASFAPAFTPTESVADVDVGAPTVPAGLKLDHGCALVEVTFDTDGGSTKTYAAGDSVAVQVQVKADNSLLGWPVAAITRMYNVV